MVPHLQFKKALAETALDFMGQTYLSDLQNNFGEITSKYRQEFGADVPYQNVKAETLMALADAINTYLTETYNLAKNSQNNLTPEKQLILTKMLGQLGSMYKAVKNAHHKSLSSQSWDTILKLHQDMSQNQSVLINRCSSDNSGSLPECQKFYKLIGDLIR